MPHQTTTLYITQLEERVTEKMLQDIFSMISPVNSVKINTENQSALVDFHERRGAEQALHTMDGRTIYGQKIHLSWTIPPKKQHQRLYTILVHGLSQDMTTTALKSVFSSFSPRHVEVIHETREGDRSYGTIDFDTKQDAENAMKQMDGQYVLSNCHALQCKWANQQVLDTIHATDDYDDALLSRPATPQTPSFSNASLHPSTTHRVSTNNTTYEQIFAQTPPYNTSVYIENLPSQVSEQDLVPHFQQYGYVSHITLDHERGATVKMDTHSNASMAIFALQDFNIKGKSIHLRWGTHINDTEHPAMNYASCSSLMPLTASSNLPSSSASSSAIPTSSFYNAYGGHRQREQWWFQPTGLGYYNTLTMRPPAPVAGSPHSSGGKAGAAVYGWNQHYENYYSAGHQNI